MTNVYRYKEIRKIYMCDLKNLCIKHNYFTHGNCEQYDKLLRMVEDKKLTTDLILRLALNIFEHSELNLNYFTEQEHLQNIMFLIAKASYTYFEEL